MCIRDRNKRNKDDAIPNVIREDKDIQKEYAQYWVGYCMNKHLKQVITILHPDFINEASCIDKHHKVVKIFNKAFIDECMISKKFVSSINRRSKNFLNKMAFDAGNHPRQRVKKIRYHYQQKRVRKNGEKVTKGNEY